MYTLCMCVYICMCINLLNYFYIISILFNCLFICNSSVQ